MRMQNATILLECFLRYPSSAEVNEFDFCKTNANLSTIWHQFLSLDTILLPPFSTCK